MEVSIQAQLAVLEIRVREAKAARDFANVSLGGGHEFSKNWSSYVTALDLQIDMLEKELDRRIKMDTAYI